MIRFVKILYRDETPFKVSREVIAIPCCADTSVTLKKKINDAIPDKRINRIWLHEVNGTPTSTAWVRLERTN